MTALIVVLLIVANVAAWPLGCAIGDRDARRFFGWLFVVLACGPGAVVLAVWS